MSDLISRADVLSLFPNAFYDGLASQIKALPSVSAECESCVHNNKEWDSVECDGCTRANSNYEPNDLISRADLLRVVQDPCNEGEWSTEEVVATIDIMPSVSVVSKEEYDDVKGYMNTLVDAFIEDGNTIADLEERLSIERTRKYKLNDGTEIDLDEESYEIGYTHGQMSVERSGEWIESPHAKGYVYCDQCNKQTMAINTNKYNYCPFCGAKMKGDADNDARRNIE